MRHRVRNFTAADFEEIFTMRLALEPLAARLASRRLQSTDVVALTENLKRMRKTSSVRPRGCGGDATTSDQLAGARAESDMGGQRCMKRVAPMPAIMGGGMRVSRLNRLLPGLIACLGVSVLLAAAQAATYSLADDFSYTNNETHSTWSYRLDDIASSRPQFPLLTSANRDANSLWGSTFQTPPRMWCEASGYWGIGKNATGRELFSAPNGTRWAPGEVLLHPKAGASPSGLVVASRWDGSWEIDYAPGDVANFTVRRDGNGFGQAAATGPSPRGTWHHLVLVFSGGKMTGYVDGVQGSEADIGGVLQDGGLSPDHVMIGAARSGTASSFNLKGLIDEVAIYDYPLTQLQVRTRYRALVVGAPSLTIQNAVIVSWPGFPADYVLQSANDINGPYQQYTGKISVDAGTLSASVPTGTRPPFFRLAQPSLLAVRSFGAAGLNVPAAPSEARRRFFL